MKSHRKKPFISTYLERVNELNVSYMHPKARMHTGIVWDNNPELRLWEVLEERKELLKDVPRSIQIKNSPEWARVYPQYQCSPIKPEYWHLFANFVVEVVKRYEPYAVEIWNEPETYRGDLPENYAFILGCWGEPGRWYETGEELGKFMSTVYGLIKDKVDVDIWGGALMLGNENHWEFTQGFINRAMYDQLSYHSYSGYSPDYTHAIEKAKRLREMTDKPLVLSETAFQWEIDDRGPEWAAEYFDYTYSKLEENGIVGMNWYTLANNGWKNTDLVWREYKRPAHQTYWRLCDEL